MTALPAQVRKQVERANEIAAQVNAPPPPDGQPATSVTPPVPDVVAAQPAQTPPPEAASQTPAPQPTDSWEHKYKVLQGKYNTEIPRLQQQLREALTEHRQLKDEVVSMRTLLASLGPRQNAEATPAAPPQAERLVKDEEIREFGADLIDVVKRAAREAVIPELDSHIDRRVQPVLQKVENVERSTTAVRHRVARADEQSVKQLLTEQVPNWQVMDTDEGFNNWLDEVDPYSGKVRGEMLTEAYRAFDGPRVVAFFKGYLNEHAAVQPSSAQPSAQARQGGTQVQLNELVAPGGPKAGAAGAQDGAGNKRIWTASDIRMFYREVQSGKYRRNPERQKQIEADIFAAQNEGRIRP